jgi:transposase
VIQLTPQMRFLVCTHPVDFRKGIDGLAALCRQRLADDPFSGTVFVFRNHRSTAVKLLAYDGQGFWLCLKRLSKGRFGHWPSADGVVKREVLAHQLQVLLVGGDKKQRSFPQRPRCAPPQGMKTLRTPRPRKAPARGKPLEVNAQELEALLGRLEVYMPAEDFAQVAAINKAVLELAELLQEPGMSVAELRRRTNLGAP